MHDQATVVRGLQPLPVAIRGRPRRRLTGEGRCVRGGGGGEKETCQRMGRLDSA